VENAEGKRLMEWIEENGWEVFNKGHGPYRYQGETVMDYGIVNEELCFEEEKGRERTEKKRGGG
jgi:hypothetical protein